MTKASPKLKKPKKLPVTKLKKEADRLFSIFIRKRDKGVCITCKKVQEWKYTDAGHYVPRDCFPLRYDERNTNCQCKHCNIFKKGNYHIYALKMIERYGDNILYELYEIFKEDKDNNKKYEADFYQEIINRYNV